MRPIIVLIVGGSAACAGHRPAAVSPEADPCALVPPPAGTTVEGARGAGDRDGGTGVEATAPVVVGVSGAVSSTGAPVPRTSAERLVFAHLYGTLIRVACDGRIEPRLAAAWRSGEDGRRWTFTLHADARDWDARPVTAEDVASSWLAARAAAAGDAGADDAAEDPLPTLLALTVRNDRTLHVELSAPTRIEAFGHPALAIRTSARSSSGWPAGTGPYRPRAGEPAGGDRGRSVTLDPVAGGAPLEFRAVGGDARNALDGGVDLLATSDPAALDYAAATGAFSAIPLAWDRAYVLAAPAASSPAPAAAPAAFARDVVRGEARAADALAGELASCAAGAGSERPPESRAATTVAAAAGTPRLEPRILYLAADPVARSLAERLVALARDPTRPDAGWISAAVPPLVRDGARLRAVGLPASRFADALRAGDAVGYVLRIGRGPGPDACDEARAVARRAPWLDRPPSDPTGTDAVPALLPLVETRSTLLVRRGIGGIGVDGRGTLLLDGVRRVPSPGGGAGEDRPAAANLPSPDPD